MEITGLKDLLSFPFLLICLLPQLYIHLIKIIVLKDSLLSGEFYAILFNDAFFTVIIWNLSLLIVDICILIQLSDLNLLLYVKKLDICSAMIRRRAKCKIGAGIISCIIIKEKQPLSLNLVWTSRYDLRLGFAHIF